MDASRSSSPRRYRPTMMPRIRPIPAPRASPSEGAADGDADVAEQILVQQQLHEGVPGGGRRRQRRRRNDAGLGQDPPGDEDRDRHDQADGERAPPGPLPAVADGERAPARGDVVVPERSAIRGAVVSEGRPALPSGCARTCTVTTIRLEFLATTLLKGRSKMLLDVERVGNQPELLEGVGLGLLVADDGRCDGRADGLDRCHGRLGDGQRARRRSSRRSARRAAGSSAGSPTPCRSA